MTDLEQMAKAFKSALQQKLDGMDLLIAAAKVDEALFIAKQADETGSD